MVLLFNVGEPFVRKGFSRKEPRWHLLRWQSLLCTLLIALMQTPHRFRSKRQLWTYSGLGIETHDSAQYRYVGGQLHKWLYAELCQKTLSLLAVAEPSRLY
jgi:hypothetical protein